MKTVVAVGALLLGTGCIADQMAFNPLFTEGDRVEEAGLVGAWTSDDKDDPLLATIRAKDGDYELVAIEDGKPQRPLALRLGRIGGRLYWDAWPGETEQKDGPAEVQLLPLHSIAEVTVCADRLLVAPLRSDWTKSALADGRLDTPHVLIDGDPVLSGETWELRQLIADHANDDGAFGKALPVDPCRTTRKSDELIVLRRRLPDPELR